MPFIATTQKDLQQRGWDELDVIFVSGDAYIDHPAFGVPLLARWLEAPWFSGRHNCPAGLALERAVHGAWSPPVCSLPCRPERWTRWWPITPLPASCGMMTRTLPETGTGHVPTVATMVYTSRLKEAFKDVPVVIGGIEASLRRFAHYDFWENKVRRSILFDAKADLLIYGMAERAILEVAERMRSGERLSDIRDVRGTAYNCSRIW